MTDFNNQVQSTQTEAKTTIFRPLALERLSSPEQLDQVMQITTPKEWLILLGLGSVVLLGVLWSIFGRLPLTVEGRGILLIPEQITDLQSPISGQLQALKVQPGQCIQKNQIVATIDPAVIRQKLILTQEKLAQLQQQDQETQSLINQRLFLEQSEINTSRTTIQERLRSLQTITPSFKQTELTALKEQKASLKADIQVTEKMLPMLRQRWQKRQELLKEGAISGDNVIRSEQEYIEEVKKVSQLKANLKQLNVTEQEIEQRYLKSINESNNLQTQLQELNTRIQRLNQENAQQKNLKTNEIQGVMREIVQLKQQINDFSKIVSLHTGCILELTTREGQIITPGDRLGSLTLTNSNQQLTGITYFAVKDGKKIKPGMKIIITPDTVKREQFGGIVGKITEVSSFPVTQETVKTTVGNPDLATTLIGSKTSPKIEGLIEVKATLNPAKNNFSRYQWSSSQGPKLKMSSGTLTHTNVIIEEQAPITLLLPILRESTGIY